MKWRWLISATLICFWSAFCESAFTQSWTFSHIGLESGLSQSSILSMEQDALGFWWLGTQDGLNRFDGYTVQTYKNQPFDQQSLAVNRIEALMSEENGYLWVGTYGGGLHVFDPVNQIFRRLNSGKSMKGSLSDDHIADLLTDQNGYIWAATRNGINRLSVSGGDAFRGEITVQQFLTSENRENSYPDKAIACLFESGDGTLWAGGIDKLFKLEMIGGDDFNISVLNLPPASIPEVDKMTWRMITDIQSDKDGKIWLGTNMGLYSLENVNSEQILLENYLPKHTRISDIVLDEDGNLLIATEGQGMYYRTCDSRTRRYSEFFRQVKASQSGKGLTSNYLAMIAEDRINKGSYWIGTAVNGVDIIQPNLRKFRTNSLTDLNEAYHPGTFIGGVFKDRNENVWMALESGMLFYHHTGNNYQYLWPENTVKSGLGHPKVYSFAESKDGSVWVGTRRGIAKSLATTGGKLKFRNFTVPDSCPEMAVYSIRKEKDGKFLIGSAGGVNIFDPENPGFQACNKCLDTLSAKQGYYLVTAVHRDRKNRLWVGSTRGLVMLPDWDGTYEGLNISKLIRFEYQPSDTTSIPTSYINSIAEDHQGHIWLGSSNGLIRIREKEDKFQFKVISEKDGLANEMVYAVLFDENTESLWMSTNRGISRYRICTGKLDNYGPQDGLQGYEFNQGAYCQAEDGEIFMGGLNGYSRFFPAEIAINPNPPLIWISSIQTPTGKQKELTYKRNKSIELDYQHNSFTLHFIGLGMHGSTSKQYAYRLVSGRELPNTRWINLGTQHQVSLSKLSPGRYTFEVKGANRDGVWSETGDTLAIYIRPPFWQTRAFYFLLLVSLGMLLWGLHAYRVQIKVRRIRDLERVRKNAAADFHDELGHKLTIISLFGEILKKQLDGSSKKVEPHVNKIISTANSLYYAMKDLLWVLDPDKDTIIDLVILLKDFGDELFDKTGIAFRTEGLPGEMAGHKLTMDQKRHIMLIFKEVMNNSLKHAAPSNVVLSANLKQNRLEIELEDDGKGFDLKEAGGGHGLTNVHDRAKSINASLIIESDSSGTCVQLDCPLVSVAS